MGRPNRHEYYMQIARAVSARATCDRAAVGALLVVGDRIVTTGYNGSPPGHPHCDDVGHDIVDGRCVRVIHAEENALIQAALHGVATKGALCYCTMLPCVRCTGRLYSAGIRRIIYADIYKSMKIEDQSRLAEFVQSGLSIHRIVDGDLQEMVHAFTEEI